MSSSATISSCTDCISQCNQQSCKVPLPCTDQCTIIPCPVIDDPCLSDDCDECVDPCDDDACSSIDTFTCHDRDICTDSHPLFDCCPNSEPYSFFDENCIFDLDSCCNNISSSLLPPPSLLSSPSLNQSELSSPSIASPPSAHLSTIPAFELPESKTTSMIETLPSLPLHDSLSPVLPYRCLWNGCNQSLSTAEELVAHVNAAHLWWAAKLTQEQHSTCEQNGQFHIFPGEIGCMWDHCSLYPNVDSIPSTSISCNKVQPIMDLLTSHLLQDHLGLLKQVPQEIEQPTTAEPIPEASISVDSDTVAILQHICKWRNCSASFSGYEQLNDHISLVHIGAGKTQYDCWWEGCNRHDDRAFPSKQKVLRHIQTHTGHRPFQCPTCHQNFSETATLQQHMRRHTQEKPYVCDHPGCGKQFSIVGALTIHKRIHNGDKPFKCTYCDRAFSESSNLSKHVRTHTGDKPYECKVQGCGKRFARPDQLTRHSAIHRKSLEANFRPTIASVSM